MVYLVLAPGFEEVEALTPLDYLRRVGQEVKVLGVGSQVVTGAHGITVHCDCIIEEAEALPDMLVLPGGMPGTKNLERNAYVAKQIEACYWGGKFVAAICAAPSILGHMGLLEGKKATCFPGFEQELQGAEVLNEPVVRDDRIITAKGAGVANQFAFALIEALCGKEEAETLKATIQWQ